MLIYFLLNLAASILCIIFRGYTLTIMWDWFVTSQFTQIPHLSVVAALGLSVTIGAFTMKVLTKDEWEKLLATRGDDDPSDVARRKHMIFWIAQTATTFVMCLVVLFVGWILHFYM